MKGYWEFQTETRQAFRIVPDKGRYVIYCGTRALGSYFSAEQALEDLVGGSIPEVRFCCNDIGSRCTGGGGRAQPA
jgi:hypothetical protein